MTSLQRPLMVTEMMHRTVGTHVSVRCKADEVIHVRLKSPETVFKPISNMLDISCAMGTFPKKN